MGVDSGLPDFRGADGFWRAYPALKDHLLTFQDVATREHCSPDPRFAGDFMDIDSTSIAELFRTADFRYFAIGPPTCSMGWLFSQVTLTVGFRRPVSTSIS